MTSHKDVMVRAAKAAGEILVRHFEQGVSGEQKADGSFVSRADEEAEQAILDILLESYPYSVVAEESGRSGSHDEYEWVIDPLDGTGNFLMGTPLWVTTIALLKDGEIVEGITHQPLSDRTYYVKRGEGFERVRDNSRYLFIDPVHGKDFAKVMTHVAPVVDVPDKSARYVGCAALTIALVASGNAHAFLGRGQNLWDVAAGILMAEEAGLAVTDWSGKQWSEDSGTLLVCPKDAHKDIVRKLDESRTKSL